MALTLLSHDCEYFEGQKNTFDQYIILWLHFRERDPPTTRAHGTVGANSSGALHSGKIMIELGH